MGSPTGLAAAETHQTASNAGCQLGPQHVLPVRAGGSSQETAVCASIHPCTQSGLLVQAYTHAHTSLSRLSLSSRSTKLDLNAALLRSDASVRMFWRRLSVRRAAAAQEKDRGVVVSRERRGKSAGYAPSNTPVSASSAGSRSCNRLAVRSRDCTQQQQQQERAARSAKWGWHSSDATDCSSHAHPAP
jgi:hypothetical protein